MWRPKLIQTFGALADSWIANRIEQSRKPGAGYRPSTLAQWQSHIAHMKACFESVKVSEIDAIQIEKAIAVWRLPKAQDGRGLAQRTVAKVSTTMSRIFRFGIRRGCGVETDQTKLIETGERELGRADRSREALYTGLHEVTEKEVLTPQEAKQVVLAASPAFIGRSSRPQSIPGRVSVNSWRSGGQMSTLTAVFAIRRTVSTARVKGEAVQEKHRWFNPKTKKGSREIPIPSDLVMALCAWKEKCPRSRLDLVFSNEFGEPCNRTGIGRYGLAPALVQAGIDKSVTMHGLRHTYASMLILLKRPIPAISAYLGHADVSITMRVYAHFLKDKKQDTMSDLERLIHNG